MSFLKNLKNRINSDEYLKKALIIFLVIKIILFIVGTAGQFIPEELTNRQHRSDNILLNPWTQYDAIAYVDIAQNGYNQDFAEGRGNYGWYPFFPMLILLLSFLGYYASGFIISNTTSIIAVIILYDLVKDEFGDKTAYKTVILLSLFPTAYFFNAIYTESIFLLGTLAFFWFMKKERYLEAGIVGFFTAMARTQGVVLFLPALYMYYKKYNLKLNKNLLPLLLIPLGLGVFLLYHFLITGDAFIQFKTHLDFQRSITLPTDAIVHSISVLMETIALSDIKGAFYQSFNLFTLGFFGILLYYTYRYVNKEYFLYFLVSFIIPLLSARLEAITRFYLVLFPAFIALTIIEKKNPLLIKILYIGFAVLLVLFTLRHVNEDLFLSGII